MRTTLLILAMAGALASGAAAEQPQPTPIFPDLEFAGVDGGSVQLSQLKGNVVLLNVWATWCGPCKLELPLVQKMYDTYSDRNFVVVSVNVDADRRRVGAFLKQFNISIPVYFAAPVTAPHVNVGVPLTLAP